MKTYHFCSDPRSDSFSDNDCIAAIFSDNNWLSSIFAGRGDSWYSEFFDDKEDVISFGFPYVLYF